MEVQREISQKTKDFLRKELSFQLLWEMDGENRKTGEPTTKIALYLGISKHLKVRLMSCKQRNREFLERFNWLLEFLNKGIQTTN